MVATNIEKPIREQIQSDEDKRIFESADKQMMEKEGVLVSKVEEKAQEEAQEVINCLDSKTMENLVEETAYETLERVRCENKILAENRILNAKNSLQAKFISDLQLKYIQVLEKCVESVSAGQSSTNKLYIEILDKIAFILNESYISADKIVEKKV